MLPSKYTPHLYESLVRLSAWLPFAEAVKTLHALVGVEASAASARRATEGAGAAYVALQDEAVATLERKTPRAPAGPDQVVLSADGAMVPLLGGQWSEVRTLAIGEAHVTAKGEVHTQHHSYFSRLASAEEFTRLALVETHQRGIENSPQAAAVMDGADWLQGFVDHHCPRAVRILDFAHAAQRIGESGQALFGGATPEAQVWTEHWLHSLKHDGPAALLAELQAQQAEHPTLAVLAKHLAYLEKRQDQMAYPAFSQQGWPIGSGMVESANKNVVEARLKGTGMHWQATHVNPMLALRTILCSDRWETAWPQIETHLRTQTAHHRRHRCQQRRQAKADRLSAEAMAPLLPASPPAPAPTADQLPATATAATPIVNHRPAANHPWRRAAVGRARFQT